MSFYQGLPPGLRAYLLSIPFDDREEALDELMAEIEAMTNIDTPDTPSDDSTSYAWRERDSGRFTPESRKEIVDSLSSYFCPRNMPIQDSYLQALSHKRDDQSMRELAETTIDLTSYMTTIDELGDPVLISGVNNLLIGDIQSGKTQALVSLIATALDLGSRVAVIITGTTEKLRKQTQRRINEDLISHNHSILSPTTHGDLMSWDPGNHTSAKFWGNLRELVFRHLSQDESNTLVIAVKKNRAVLEGVHHLCHYIQHHLGFCEHPILIIDDEGDSASINTSTDQPYDVRGSAVGTAVHKAIVRLRNDFSSLFWNVTATPAASIFLHPEDPLFPDYAHVLDPHSLYLSPHEVFIEQRERLVEPCVIEDYNPPISSKEIVPHLQSLENPPDSMVRAMLNHAISGALHHLKPRPVQPHGEHHAAMVHVCSQIDGMKEVTRLTKMAIKDAKAQLEGYEKTRDKGSNVHNSILRFQTNKRALCDSDASFPPTDELISKAIEVLVDSEVRTIHSESDHDLNYDDPNFPVNMVVVGGLVLSRGLTLEGLRTTYMVRQAKDAVNDTMLQAARWLGPLAEDKHLMSIHLTPALSRRFTNITWDDMMLRKEIRMVKEEDLSLRDVQIPVHEHHRLSRKSLHMRRSRSAGERVLINAPWIDTNGAAITALRQGLSFVNSVYEPTSLMSPSGKAQGLLWDISLSEFEQFISMQKASPNKGGAEYLRDCRRRIRLMLEQLEEPPRVNLVLRNGSGVRMSEELPSELTTRVDIGRVVRASSDGRTVDQLISGKTQGQDILTSDWFIDGFVPVGPTSREEGWRGPKDPIMCVIYVIDDHKSEEKRLIGNGPWICFAINYTHGGPGGSVISSKHNLGSGGDR